MGLIMSLTGETVEDTGADPTTVRNVATTLYCVGALLFAVLWLLVVGVRNTRREPIVAVGFGFTLLLLLINAVTAQQETIGDYASERNESIGLDRNAFYIIGTILTFSSLIKDHRGEEVRGLLPLIMAGIFFAVINVLAPVWVSTTDPRETIYLKHVRTVSMLWGMGFVVATLALLWFRGSSLSLRHK